MRMTSLSKTGKIKMENSKKSFEPQIYELISEPDNVEKIRDRLALIIKGETQNQYAIAQETGSPDADDFNFRVFIENTRPYDTGGEPPVEPFVNVMLQKAAPLPGNPRMGAQKESATFLIDCIAFGNDGGEEWDEKAASIRAWKTARIIRALLMSEQYLYLGLRGVVGARNIISMETGTPDNDENALTVITVRIALDVQFLERFIGVSGPILNEIDYTVVPFNGEVIINN
jgi:hypothetical protein